MSRLAVHREDLAEDPPWPSIGALVRDASRRFEERELLRFPDETLSFRDVDERTDELATALVDRGVAHGDRVALLLPNQAAFPLAWLSVLKLGAVAVPVGYSARSDDLQHALSDSGASVLVTAPDQIDLIERVRAAVPGLRHVVTFDELAAEAARGRSSSSAHQVGAGDLANLQFTSGTTGLPKACMLTHDYWLRLGWQAAGYAELLDDDVVLTAQAYSYLDPQWCTVMCLIAGVPLVVLPRFSASSYWDSVRAHDVSFLYLVGSMPLLLLEQPPAASEREHRVRLVLCSGIVPELHATLEARYGAPWREAFGMTETGVDFVVHSDETDSVGSGTIGRVTPTKRARIVDADRRPVPAGETGELCVKGAPMTSGYWNRAEETAAVFADGWFHTGDLARADASGRHYLAGRVSDRVRRGGENVSSAEVERVLVQHPWIVDAAVIGVPDRLWGEEVKAYVELRAGVPASGETASSIRGFVLERLARHKAPRFLEFVDAFPRTPSERIAKDELRAPDRMRSDETYDMAVADERSAR